METKKEQHRIIMQQFENTVIRGVTIRFVFTVLASTILIVWGGSRAYNGILSEISEVKTQNQITRMQYEVLKTQVDAIQIQVKTIQGQVDEIRFKSR